MHKDITGILLAGGKSSRMGTNKSFLDFNGKYIIEHIHDMLKSMFERVIIITNSPAEYGFLGSEIHEDINKGKGPLGGIHSGLTYSPTNQNFIISCDVPLVSPALIDYIISRSFNSQITAVEADGHIQKLCGVYSKECLEKIDNIFKNENSHTETHSKSKCMVGRLIESSNSNIINEDEIPFSIKNQFLNLNRIEDYEMLKNHLLYFPCKK